MCIELQALLSKYNFGISMIGENEEIMRLQGRMLFMKFFNILDATYLAQNGD